MCQPWQPGQETRRHHVILWLLYACLLQQERDLKSAPATNSHWTPGAAWVLDLGWALLRAQAIPAVVSTLRLDAAALGALVDHLARLQLQALHVLLRGIALGDSALCTEIEIRLGEKKAEQ